MSSNSHNESARPIQNLGVFALLFGIFIATGCTRSEAPPISGASQKATSLGAGVAALDSAPASAATVASTANVANAASIGAAASPVAARASAPASARKIIRQAELELEVDSESAAETAVERAAERRGGYVVSATRETEQGAEVVARVAITVRVPQAELTDTIAEVKRLGRGVGSERITSNDVTDEYVDLTARMTSQKQLEQQYLEILKRATTVTDAMAVQKELAEVRTEIERMQGRQQLLQNESALSTLTVHLSTAVPKIAVSTNDFRDDVRRAWSDAQSTSAELLSGAIRALGVLAPLFVLLVMPSALGIWVLLRFARWRALRRQQRLTLA